MFHFMKTWFLARLPKDEKGQDAAEYALLIGLIALVVIAGVTVLGTNLDALFSDIGSVVGTW